MSHLSELEFAWKALQERYRPSRSLGRNGRRHRQRRARILEAIATLLDDAAPRQVLAVARLLLAAGQSNLDGLRVANGSKGR